MLNRHCNVTENTNGTTLIVYIKFLPEYFSRLSFLISNIKQVVLGVSCFSGCVFKIHTESASFFCQTVNVIKSKPIFTSQISEATRKDNRRGASIFARETCDSQASYQSQPLSGPFRPPSLIRLASFFGEFTKKYKCSVLRILLVECY